MLYIHFKESRFGYTQTKRKTYRSPYSFTRKRRFISFASQAAKKIAAILFARAGIALKKGELSPISLIALMQELYSTLTFPTISMSKTVKKSKRHLTNENQKNILSLLSHHVAMTNFLKEQLRQDNQTVLCIGLCINKFSTKLHVAETTSPYFFSMLQHKGATSSIVRALKR